MRRLLSPSVILTSRRRGRTPVAIAAAPAAFSRLLSQPVSPAFAAFGGGVDGDDPS
jgi:hypothetical protein